MAPSRLEKTVSSNPLVILAGVAVAAGTLVAGIMSWASGERIEAVQLVHKAELSQMAEKNREDLVAATEPLKRTIEDLSFRISSIERRLPGSGPSYLDVSKVTIGPDAVKTLDPGKYKPFFDEGLFIAVPESADCRFRESDELHFLESTYSFVSVLEQKAPEVMKSVAMAKMLVWQCGSPLVMKTGQEFLGSRVQISLAPTITVEQVSLAMLRERVAAISNLMTEEDASGDAADKKNTVEKLKAEIATEHAEGNGTNPPPRPESGEPGSAAIEAQQIVATVDRKKHVLSNLDQLISGDLANFVFTDIVGQGMMQSGMGISHRIVSAEKKGNVLYIQEQLVLNNLDIAEANQPPRHVGKIVIDAESFFFGSGDSGYLVRVFAPPTSNKFDAYTWSRKWFAGFQVAID